MYRIHRLDVLLRRTFTSGSFFVYLPFLLAQILLSLSSVLHIYYIPVLEYNQ